MTTLTLDLPAADEAAFRELAEAPPDVRAVALQEAIEILRRGAQRSGASANGTNGHKTISPPERPETTKPLTALEVLAAPPDVREAALRASEQASVEFYASPAGQAEWEELADWHALDGEPFHFPEEEESEAL
jgi:hypothetical protein